MTTKKDAQFSFEDCACMEMMSQFKDQMGMEDACAEMMSLFADPQGTSECFEVMSQMMASCCDIQHHPTNYPFG